MDFEITKNYGENENEPGVVDWSVGDKWVAECQDVRFKAGGVLIFEGRKENDLDAGVKSNNIYSTCWPRDSKVVREEATINLGDFRRF